ncbi:ankyrin repeat domain-containing protein [Vibrio profundum]|uniref:hypothetical protein n=1 Tax=Vibrio profundum TaxID=2910247 RepID=UPI003D0ED4C7
MNDNIVEKVRNNKALSSLNTLFFNPIAELDEQFCEGFQLALDQRKKIKPILCPFGNNILHYALMINHPMSAYIAHRYPELKNQKNGHGQLPIHFAAFHENLSLDIFYPDRGITLTDDKNFTPLHIAAEKGNIQHFARLEHLAQVDNIYNALPLHWVMKNHEENSITRCNKVLMAKKLISSSPTKYQMAQKNAIDMTPNDWMELTYSSKEIDFLLK